MALDLVFYAHLVASKVGKTGLVDVTFDVERITRSTGARSNVVTAGAATEGTRGIYYYRYAAADLFLYDYYAVATTANATVDQREIPALWVRWEGASHAEIANMDAAVSSLPTDQDVRDAMKLDANVGAPAAGSVDAHLDTLVGYGAPPAMISGQQVRDAMKLDAGIGAPAAGSVDTHLDDILLLTAPAAIAAAVLDPAMAGHVIGGSVGEAIDLAANCCSGPGAIEFIYTVTSSVAPNPPVPSASVWVSTDPAGANVIASGFTDMLGNVTFWLDPGLYYFWRAHSGFTGVNPDLETVV